MGLTFTQLVEQVADSNRWTKKSTRDLLVSVFQTLRRSTLMEGSVSIPDFGKFEVFTRPARNAHNPKTGESVKVPPRKAFRFKPSISLKNELKETS